MTTCADVAFARAEFGPSCMKTMSTAPYLYDMVSTTDPILSKDVSYAATAARELKVRATVRMLSKIVKMVRDTLIVTSLVVSALYSFKSQSGPSSTPIPITVIMIFRYLSILASS